MLRRAMADGLRWAGGYRAVNWRADGLWRADGCGAGERMVCGEMADAVQGAARCYAERRQMACRGGSPDVVPCVAWFVARRRVARRGSKDGAPGKQADGA